MEITLYQAALKPMSPEQLVDKLTSWDARVKKVQAQNKNAEAAIAYQAATYEELLAKASNMQRPDLEKLLKYTQQNPDATNACSMVSAILNHLVMNELIVERIDSARTKPRKETGKI